MCCARSPNRSHRLFCCHREVKYTPFSLTFHDLVAEGSTQFASVVSITIIFHEQTAAAHRERKKTGYKRKAAFASLVLLVLARALSERIPLLCTLPFDVSPCFLENHLLCPQFRFAINRIRLFFPVEPMLRTIY